MGNLDFSTRRIRLDLSRIVKERGVMLYVDEEGVPDKENRTFAEVAIDNAWQIAAHGNNKDAIAALKALAEITVTRFDEFKNARDIALWIALEARRLGIDPRDNAQWSAVLAATGYDPAIGYLAAERVSNAGEAGVEVGRSESSAEVDAEELS